MHKLFTFGAVLALGATTAMAQEFEEFEGDFGPEAGDWELILGGSGSNDEDFENVAFSVNAELGYYFTENLLGAVRQQAIYADLGNDSSWNGGTSLALDYVFDMDRWRPFVGASVGYLYGDATDDTWIAGPEAGLRYYVLEDTFIYGRAAWEFLFEDTDDADDAFSDGRWVYVVGVGFNW